MELNEVSKRTIQLFGGLAIKQDTQPIPKLISRKADILLAYLAQERRIHSREALATLLWDDRSQKQALSNLRTLLTSLRKQANAFVQITNKTLQIQDEVVTDTHLFMEQLHAAENAWPSELSVTQLEEALTLYRGDFLEGVLLANSLELENWIQTTREQLRQKVLMARQKLLAHYLCQGAYHDGLRHGSILLEMDPWDENVHRQMMQLYAYSGQRQAALAQYETCVNLLDTELGLAPAPETTDLYERIQTAVSTSSNLPAFVTTFIGREQELGLCIQHLRNPDCRLLTIVGLGGIGKTRLALQAASSLQMDFINGCHFVSLAAVESVDEVAMAIVEAIDAPFVAANVETQLLDYLRNKEMLIILDNFEHLLNASSLLLSILQTAPNVKFFITSRVRLNIRPEWLLELSGLAYPIDLGINCEQCAAVQLFWQRARVIMPEFELTQAIAPSVNRICQIVRGLPLGIELAAAWIRVLSPAQIAQQIEQNLDLLATRARDVPERQQSLTAVFDSVWHLLDENEQQVFAQLSVFHGSFDLTAFLQITGASPWTLAALVEKSLLQKDDQQQTQSRYHLVELLRLYSTTKRTSVLLDDTQVRQQHSDYYLAFLQEKGSQINSQFQPKIIHSIGQERENIRAAWLWAVQQSDIDQIRESIAGLVQFYLCRGPYQEGLRLMQTAVEKVKSLPETSAHQETLANLYLTQGRLWQEASQLDDAEMALQAAAGCLANLEAPILNTMLEMEYGRLSWRKSMHETAVKHSQSALIASRELNLQNVAADALRMLGAVAVEHANYQDAEVFYKEALEIAQKCSDRINEAKVINNLGVCYTEIGDFDQAQRYHQRSLEMRLQLGDQRGEGSALNNLGILALGREQYQKAQTYFEQSRQTRQSLGDRRGESLVIMNLARVYGYLGNYKQAHALLAEALAAARKANSSFIESQVLVISTLVAGQSGDYENAYRYANEALKLAEIHHRRSLKGHIGFWIGQSLLGCGQIAEAYQQLEETLVLREALGEINLIVESQAGLASAFLAQNRIDKALSQIEPVLVHLQTHGLEGTDDPSRIRLTCCQVLRARQDPRASAFIENVYNHLQTQANDIEERKQRQIFLENVPAHAQIVSIYQQQI